MTACRSSLLLATRSHSLCDVWAPEERRLSYLHPVKNLLVTGHILQEESLQMPAHLLRRQDPFGQSCLRIGAVWLKKLEFLLMWKWQERTRNEKVMKRGEKKFSRCLFT